MPTLTELLEQQADIAAQIAEYEPQLVEDAQAVLTGEAALELVAKLTAVRDQLRDGAAKTQISNVLTVLSGVPQVLTHELSRLAPKQVDAAPMMESMARLKAFSDAQKIEQSEIEQQEIEQAEIAQPEIALEMTPN